MSDEQTEHNTVYMYADGACKGNPGVGGWGALLRYQGHEKAICGGALDTTNNRMELQAVIEGLKLLKRPCVVAVYTDSRYVQQGISEWIVGWKAKGWRTANKKPVKNDDLWKELDALTQGHTISWYWVKGHAGHPGNERADELANEGVDKVLAGQA